jgi:Flp pilus assembly protein TadD
MHRNPRRAAVKRADASAICAAAAALASRGQAGEAIAGYRLALVIEPRCARAHSDLAQLLSGQGRLEEAICHMKRAIACAPELAAPAGNPGDIFARKFMTTETA